MNRFEETGGVSLEEAKGGGALSALRNKLMASKGNDFEGGGGDGGSRDGEGDASDGKPDELDRRLSDEGRLALIREMTYRKEKLRVDLKEQGIPLKASEDWKKARTLEAQILDGILIYRDKEKHGKDSSKVKERVRRKLDEFHALETALEMEVVTAKHKDQEEVLRKTETAAVDAEGLDLDAETDAMIVRLKELSREVYGRRGMVRGLERDVETATSLLGRKRSESGEAKLANLLEGFKRAEENLERELKSVAGTSDVTARDTEESIEEVRRKAGDIPKRKLEDAIEELPNDNDDREDRVAYRQYQKKREAMMRQRKVVENGENYNDAENLHISEINSILDELRRELRELKQNMQEQGGGILGAIVAKNDLVYDEKLKKQSDIEYRIQELSDEREKIIAGGDRNENVEPVQEGNTDAPDGDGEGVGESVPEVIGDDVWGKIANGEEVPGMIVWNIAKKINSHPPLPLTEREQKIFDRRNAAKATTLFPRGSMPELEEPLELTEEVTDEEINQILKKTPLPYEGDLPNQKELKELQKEIYGNRNKDVQRVALKLVNELRHSNTNNPPREMKVPQDYYFKILQKFPTPNLLDEYFEEQQDELRAEQKELREKIDKKNEAIGATEQMRINAIDFELGFFEEKKEDGSNGYKDAIEEFKQILYGERNEVWNKIKENNFEEESDRKQAEQGTEEILEQPEEGINEPYKVEEKSAQSEEAAPPEPLMTEDMRSPEVKAAGDPIALVAKTERKRRGEVVRGDDLEGEFLKSMFREMRVSQDGESTNSAQEGLVALIEGEGNNIDAFKRAEEKGREYVDKEKERLYAKFTRLDKEAVANVEKIKKQIKKLKPGRFTTHSKAAKNLERSEDLEKERKTIELVTERVGMKLGHQSIIIEMELYSGLLEKYEDGLPAREKVRIMRILGELEEKRLEVVDLMNKKKDEIEAYNPTIAES